MLQTYIKVIISTNNDSIYYIRYQPLVKTENTL